MQQWLYLGFYRAAELCILWERAVSSDENSICWAVCWTCRGTSRQSSTGRHRSMRIVTMTHYSFPIDVAIKALKFNRKLFYGAALAEVLCTRSRALAEGY